ncbi:bifunctional diaminohydroxyphosphoribosylaminopyrimidine deaminase/5-amino-6-(5-phosphoribosylamino)uracil reductase RibD [Croceicoccus mobilis]|uniref:Riboflavin biosynthesis protein RibD n=1 Tax=Croceicoccus mobilis TaxID=1703339 RepID=A0A917DYC7_9SPHN|nr:bifunctional diaminohydroxyphosphoribosylaminopyrimidine deaminase/5-amino-6-(5-phosphoribosylamino)uracil reductase RibD [Croceicoccus mobilis]GGD79242.1 riboflavin biosynthesis protein RibD [Croceicoccus mobilis]
MASPQDRRWLAAAARLAGRARPLSRPNPAVGALVVKDDIVLGRGWTAAGGRPHAEAAALAQAGDAARGADIYATLEPCAHDSARGPSCSDLLAKARPARVIIGCGDPDPRTNGKGIARLQDAGVEVMVVDCPSSHRSLEGFLMRETRGRPFVTLKLALSLDGCIAMANGESQWITGPEARAHAHVLRSRQDAILVGGGTLRDDNPTLNVRLPGLEDRSPERWVLTGGDVPDGWRKLADPADLSPLVPAQYLMIEGGASAAAAFLRADHVDRLVIYRAPIVIGGGRPGITDIGLGSLPDAHGRWARSDSRMLGKDALEIYERIPCSLAS